MRSALHVSLRRRTGTAVTFLVAAVLVACAAAATSACGEDKIAEAKIGEAASNTKVEVTVHSVKVVDKITMEDGTVSTVHDDGVYVLVDMTVKNLGDTGHYVDLDSLDVAIGDTHYSADEGMPGDAQAPAEFDSLRTGDLKPGKRTRGMVLFLMPQGTLDTLTYAAEPADIVVGLEGMKAEAQRTGKAPRVGQTARGGGLAMTVHSVTYPKALTYGLWTTSAKSGDRLVVVDVTLKNLDRNPSYRIDPLSVRLIDAKDNNWGSYDRTDRGLSESAQLPLKRLAPGGQVRGKVVISVPAKAKIKRIRYEVGVMGPPLESRVGS